MPEFYNPQYYTLDKIPAHRLAYIKTRIKHFIAKYDIKNSEWPLDCTRILQKMRATQLIPFEYGFFNLSEKYDAITDYRQEYNVYLMQINRLKVRYPFEYSSDRRLNFTLAHEIGHIMLDHLTIPRDSKSTLELKQEEYEAHEFASRLLLPEAMLYTCNFYSIDKVAEYFNVSKTALWMRLNNMKRLDLLSSRRTKSCSICGNISFSPFAEYCGICGTPLQRGLTGMRKIIYPTEIQMDRYKRVLVCPVCHSSKHFSGEKCTRCGTPIFNFCSGIHDDSCTYANLGNARYCEICGKPTIYYQRGLLESWNVVTNNGASNSHIICNIL